MKTQQDITGEKSDNLEENKLLSVEVQINNERIFGLYGDGNMFIKNEATFIAMAQKQLKEALFTLNEFTQTASAP